MEGTVGLQLCLKNTKNVANKQHKIRPKTVLRQQVMHFSLSLHLLDLVQVTVNIVLCGGGIQIHSVLLYFLLYEISYILVDCLYGLVWPWQIPHQARKRVVKLWSEAGQTNEAFIQK